MSIIGHLFAEYLIIDPDTGEWLGLRDDAPPEAVAAYNEVMGLPEFDKDKGTITSY